MRVVLISCSIPFRLAVCQGILDTDAQLVAVLKRKGKAKGLPGLVRSAGHATMCSWPGAFIKLGSDPSYAFLRQNKVKYLRMPSVRDPQFVKILCDLHPDIIVVSRFGEILLPEVISISRLGVLNIHCSLLPQLRGPAPIAGAIIGGFSESGVTIHYMDRGIDTGDIVLQKHIPLEAAETNQTFCEKAARLMRPMIAEVIGMFLAGNVTRIKQDPSKASYFSIKKIFGTGNIYVDWSQPSRIIGAFIRAGVRCLTSYNGADLRIREARLAPSYNCENIQHGTIIAKTKTELVVSTSDKPLEIALSPVRSPRWWFGTDYREFAKGSAIKVRRLLGWRPLSTLNEGDQLESVNWPSLKDILPILKTNTVDCST